MKIKNSTFIKGVRGSDEILEDGVLNIAFYGRSNVGKSSCINAILGRKNLVKSSSTPGKTREINFFKVDFDNDDFVYAVDLPGYGYAKLGERDREKLRKMILWYLMYSEIENRNNIVVLDIKVGLSDFDREVVSILKENNEKVFVVLNKSDKLNQKDLNKAVNKIKAELFDTEVFIFSATKPKEKTLKEIRSKIFV